MSLSETVASRRELLRFGVAALAFVPLAGLGACGFEPLYGKQAPQDNTISVSSSLAAVRIEPLRDRVGQQMHNLLRDRLNPQGQPATPGYSLRVELEESVVEVGVRIDETATRANLRMIAKFMLVSVADGSELTSGSSRATTSFDILDAPFATTVSEEDARERALRELANDIQRRLAVYFARA